MLSEQDWIFKRQKLHYLLFTDKITSTTQLAETLHVSPGWVRKWRQRLTPQTSDFGHHSCRPHRIHTVQTKALIRETVQLRGSLYSTYKRVPGPRLIAYHLKQTEPTPSPSTVYRILCRQHILPIPPSPPHVPMELPPPLSVVEIDFCDVPSIPQTDDKKQHGVEVFAALDRGTSTCLSLQSSNAYDAEGALQAVIHWLNQQGCPSAIVFDRDPRFVGNSQAVGFISAFQRCLLCLGIQPIVLPPRKPWLKPVVERFMRTVKEELLRPKKPTDLGEVTEQLYHWQPFYNEKRPHQGAACRDLPPRVAFPDLPVLRRIPPRIDPDAWLKALDGKVYVRTVQANGSIQLDKHSYSVGKRYAKQRVEARLNAHQQVLEITAPGGWVKTVAIKGLHKREMTASEYLAVILDEARSEWKTHLRLERLKRAKGR